MNTSWNVNWADVVAVLGSFSVVGLMLVWIAYVQLWRHRIRSAVRGSGQPALPQTTGEVRPKRANEERIHEYLVNANFTSEGNPNLHWKDRFLERSLI